MEDNLKFISRTEEFILLSVFKLKENAYAVPIRKHLNKMTEKTWAYGALFVMLNRLEKKGLLDSYLSDPTSQRGGRSKRIYLLNPAGKKALLDVKKAQENIWSNVSDLELEDIS